MEKKLHLVSLGCNKNLVDSEIMLGNLGLYTLTDLVDEADVLIVNTCGFIEAAKKESLQTIFELHSQRKEGSVLVVAGCLSERYKDELAKAMPEVDCFTGVGDYDKIEEIIEKRESRFSPHVFLQNEDERVITNSNSHAYIKLSEGCNQKCSFCAIPSFKGKLQSRSLRSIAKEVEELTKRGFYDFSFISQDSSSYLRDLSIEDGLISLIEEIEKIDGVKSARILYLYPTTTSLKLIKRIIKSKIFHNYFDMPIQHISDNMLKKMKRGALSSTILEQLKLMRSAPESFIRTAFIVGHPGEKMSDFNENLKLVQKNIFDRVSLFAFSNEEGTEAFKMSDHCEDEEVEKRINLLQAAVKESQDKSLEKMVGKEILVMIEGISSEHEYFMGARALSWAPEIDGEILINDSLVKSLEIGKTYFATITEKAGDKLLATVTKDK